MALTTAVMWGLLPIALKGVLTTLDVITITWYRFAAAAVIVGGVYAVRGGFRWRQLSQRRLAIPMGVAVIALLSNYWFYLVGLDHSTAEAAQVMIQLAPMLLLVLSLWVYKESFSVIQGLGLVAFLIGLSLFFNLRLPQLIEEVTAANGTYSMGLGFIVLAAITWAIYGLAQKRLLKDFNSQEVLLVIYIGGTIAFLPAASPLDVVELDSLQVGYLIFAALNTVVAYGAFGFAMEHWEASRVSATITIVPILTVFFVYITSLVLPGTIEPEPMNHWSVLGALMVVSGSMTIALVRTKLPQENLPQALDSQ